MFKVNNKDTRTTPKVNNRNTRARCEICSKLTIKTPERRQKLTIETLEQGVNMFKVNNKDTRTTPLSQKGLL